MRAFYSLLFYLATPFALLRLLWRSRREPLYRAAIGQRFGFGTRAPVDIWVHAVSAGETNAAAPLVRRLLDAGYKVVLTAMTPTGRERGRTLFGGEVVQRYAPYDLPGAQKRFIGRYRPRVLVIIDTEMWPNMIHYAHVADIRILLVNARMSEKSARGYAMVSALTRRMLAELDCVATQTEAHGERFKALGLAADKLNVAGSIKFDVSHPADLETRADAIREKAGNRRILLGASTHPGEEQAMIDAYRNVDDPSLLLVLAPRHSHRSNEVAALVNSAGLSLVRHSTGESCDPSTQVLLLDTMGELIYFYRAASLAFVGGSLTDVGGHNPMEPASLGVPVIMGPHLRNIDDIAAQFVDAGGMRLVHDAQDLCVAVKEILSTPALADELVRYAGDVMQANRGALDRVEALVVAAASEGKH